MFSRKAYLRGLATTGSYGPLPRKYRAGTSVSKKEECIPAAESELPLCFSSDGFDKYVILSNQILDRWLNLKSVARRSLMSDELPAGCCARYEGNTLYSDDILNPQSEVKYGNSYITFYHNGKYQVETIKGDVFVPTFQLSKRMEIPLSEADFKTKLRKTFDYFLNKENSIFLQLLASSCEQEICEKCNLSSFNKAFRSIEQHDLVVCKVIGSETGFKRVREITGASSFVDSNFLYTADIMAVGDSYLDDNTFYCVASPDCVGAFPIRLGMTTLWGNNNVQFFTEVGMSIINPYAVCRIKFHNKSVL